jgi:abortive infection bacteriophage resistance protein
MRYTKPALSFDEQAQRLMERGLLGIEKATLAQHLSRVNYYRLSAYWYPFKQIDSVTGEEHFAPGTAFEMIWRRYTFDRQLRLLVMDALERIEVAILRTRMVEQFTRLHGPFGYCDKGNFGPNFSQNNFDRLMDEVSEAVERSPEEFVSRFRSKYTDEKNLPLWMTAEVMTFGQLFTFFRHLQRKEQQKLSMTFGVYPPVMETWLHTLNFIRNTCAHHARPKIPEQRHRPEWYIPVKPDPRRVYTVLLILKYLLDQIDPNNDWQVSFERLLNQYSEIPIGWMGFPRNWRDCPLWK